MVQEPNLIDSDRAQPPASTRTHTAHGCLKELDKTLRAYDSLSIKSQMFVGIDRLCPHAKRGFGSESNTVQ
jgi:hypothetical protein